MEIFNLILISFAIYSFAISSGIIAEKTGQLNIAINSMMLFGALFGVLGHIIIGSYGIGVKGTFMGDIFSILFAAIGGVVGSLLLSLATLKVKADGGIAGTALNILTPVLLLIIGNSKLISGKGYASVSGGFLVKTYASSGFNWLYFTFAMIAIVVAVIMVFMFKKTSWGLRMKAIGQNAVISSISGINVNKSRFFAMTIAGLFAGMAGGMTINTSSGAFINSVGGIGFIALCLIAMSAWRFDVAIIVALLVGVAFALGTYYDVPNGTVPKELIKIIPFVLPLIALPIFARRVKAPREIGIPFEGDRR